jgi:hypothetical protein
MKWMEALKQYNSAKGMWCIPKKGTTEYFEVRALMNSDASVAKETPKKSMEDINMERREKSVAQLREATKHMKPGVRKDDYEAMNAERRNKSVAQLREATKHMKPGVREDEPPKSVKEPVKAIEKKGIPKKHLTDTIKNIKVGTEITYGQSGGYMGDGGDGRDSGGYTVYSKVTKILPRERFEVAPKYTGNKPEIFKINEDGDWLVDTNRYQNVYYIGDEPRPQKKSAEAVKRMIAKEESLASLKKAKREADWTKGTKEDLVKIITEHFSKQGKRMSNLGTASKPKLIEIITKYKIME